MQLQEGILFDSRYRLINVLGSGGFSEVWLAEDTKVGNEKRALKIYAPGKGLDRDGVQLFSSEFQLVYDLNHTHLLRPSHFDVCDRSPYLVLPFCNRGSAAKLIGKITEEEAWHFLNDVASGLAYLHEQEQPVIHQDIKPDNVLIDRTGRFLITDFGISSKARSTLRKSMGNVKSGGTIAYMAPERFGRDNTPIKASDIWSLGATLFELMTGDAPFGEHGGLIQKSGAEIPDITGNYSQNLKTAVHKMLDKETWDRPTAEQLIEWTDAHSRGNKISFDGKKQGAATPKESGKSSTQPFANPPQKKTESKPTQSAGAHVCPHCQSTDVKKVIWNWWGGLLGALIVNEYKCNNCKKTFKPGAKSSDQISSKSQTYPSPQTNTKTPIIINIWLILWFIVSLVRTVVLWISSIFEIQCYTIYSVLIKFFFSIVSLSIFLLLRKTKIGFWGLLTSLLLYLIMSISYFYIVIPEISIYAIFCGITFGILQIGKHWKTLDKGLNWQRNGRITVTVFAIMLILTIIIVSSSPYCD